ncbi:polysaccharide deacetylase family protein [Agarivorans sp.]|uniref:polysaccharide deacetylase family protein n=1 Tax=Agarivorans sp. TaxID=1872412 RepID=UPI003CFC67CF
MTKRSLAIFALSLASLNACTSDITKEEAPNQPVKYVALTFDDGPNVTLTPMVIEKLDAHNVSATFFLVGQNINDTTRDLLTGMVTRGYEFGNHSWDYQLLNNKTREQILKSVNDTQQAIINYTGTAPAFFRPPNLATSEVMFDVIDYPFASGVVGYDWSGTGATTQEVANNVINNVQDGSIVLLHDTQPLPHPTPAALDIIIPELKSRGYQFVTLSKLFEIKGVIPKAHDGKVWTTVK